MNRADRRRWQNAASLADLGELVIAWLIGDITETPSHGAGPDPETIPLIAALSTLNRSGFVTENSQLAEDGWGGYVSGFATDTTTARICAAAKRAGLTVTACKGSKHGERHGFRPCPRRAVMGFWGSACPAAWPELRDCWYVTVADPRPGRNDLLWGTLTAIAP